jgi:hypothetical protein
LADREFDGLADLASAAGVLGFMNEPFIQAIQDAIDGSQTILGTVITGSKGEFAFERERGTVITWVNNSPRFVPRFAVTNPPKYLPLRIEGQRNANIYAVSGYLDYEFCIEILKRTLLLVLFSLTLAFFTLLMDALLTKNGARGSPGGSLKVSKASPGGVPGGGEETSGAAPDSDLGLPEALDDDVGESPDPSVKAPAAKGLENPPRGPAGGEEPGQTRGEAPMNFLPPDDEDEDDPFDFDDSEDDEFPEFPDFDEDPPPERQDAREGRDRDRPEDGGREDPRDGGGLADNEISGNEPAGGEPGTGKAAEESPQAPQGLFSPRGNVGWESYTRDRLDSELHRCASGEQDLVFIICASKEPKILSDEQFRRFCEEAVLFFEHRDLVFEHRQGLSIICPNYSLEQGIAKSEEFCTRVLGKLSRPAGTKVDLRFGLSSRSGRLLDAERLMLEAGEALKRAAEDPASHVVAFKSDPEKYRQYISGR